MLKGAKKNFGIRKLFFRKGLFKRRKMLYNRSSIYFSLQKGKSDMGKVIAVSNQKGGVGKSTTVVNLAAVLGAKGKKVLIVDFDPQGNTTTSFGIRKKSIRNTVYEVLMGECTAFEAVVATEFRGVSMIPTTQRLSGATAALMNMKDKAKKLDTALEQAREFYDFILIDCPPTLDMLTINALVAANSVIVPLQCEFLSLEGLVELNNTIERVKKKFQRGSALRGHTFYDVCREVQGHGADSKRSEKIFPEAGV